MGGKRAIIIAGPCSLESEGQLNEIVEELEELKIDMIRLGVWKPRTDPRNFQGIGEKGLIWIRNLKPIYREKVAIEVANTRQVELALKYKLNKLWIGARTTTSPFAVQEIAEALRGTDVTVMVKNPVNPDLKLWIGAFERLNQMGINKMMAIHRGFHTGYEQRYRNTPLWDLPLQLAKNLPQIPIICDPSHIAGDAMRVFEIGLMARQLNFDGYMVEVHPDPVHALSDAKQQLNLKEFRRFLNEIIYDLSEDQRIKAKQCSIQYLEDQINGLQRIIENYSEQLNRVKEIKSKIMR